MTSNAMQNGEAAGKLLAVNDEAPAWIREATRIFAGYLSRCVAARTTEQPPFTPALLSALCAECLTKLDNGLVTGEPIQDIWATQARWVRDEMRPLILAAFGERFAAEFETWWPKETE